MDSKNGNTPITSHGERRGLVGELYTRLAHRLIGGTRNGKADYHGVDVVNYSKGVKAEVKGRNHTSALRWSLKQLKDRLSEIDEGSFPHGWLVVFRYTRPWRRRKAQPLYEVSRTSSDLARYLTKRTLTCHIIDVRAIQAMCHSNHAASIENGVMVDSVRVDFRMMQAVTHTGWKEELTRAGLDANEFRVWKRTMNYRFFGRQMKFQLAALVHKKPPSFRPIPLLFGKERKGILPL